MDLLSDCVMHMTGRRFPPVSPDNGLSLVDGQPPVILEKIRQLEFGNAQDVRFEGTAN